MKKLNRLMRHFNLMLVNNKGFILINRDPNPADANAGGTGAGVQDPPAGGSSDQTPEWLDVFPDEIAKDPNFTKYKTPEEFAKGYKSTVELVGRKGVLLPKDDSPEEKERFFKDLGRPEKPEEYKFAPIEGLNEGLKESVKVFDDAIGMISHKNGLRVDQANGIRADIMNVLSQAKALESKSEVDAMQSAEKAMRQEWGPSYDANLKHITSIIVKHGGEEAINAMGGAKGLGNNPVVLKTLFKAFATLREDPSPPPPGGGGGDGGGIGNETKEEATKKIEELNTAMRTDPKHPINDSMHKDHKKMVEDRMRLYKIAYPNEGGA